MKILLEELGISGGVRFMAFPAIHYGSLYADVCVPKRFRCYIMALTT
jgi:hypothetical protein